MKYLLPHNIFFSRESVINYHKTKSRARRVSSHKNNNIKVALIKIHLKVREIREGNIGTT